MKSFLIKFTCFLLVLASLLAGIGHYFAVKSPIFPELQMPVEEMPDSVDLAVIGSSHALFGIDLRQYSDSYFNFSMAGQTPAYDYMVLREYEDRIADGATVLMTVSYFSPFWTEPERQFHDKQTRYYRMLSKENILDFDSSEYYRIQLTEAIPATRIFFTEAPVVLQTVWNALTKDISQMFGHMAVKASAAEPAEENGQETLDDFVPAWYQDLDHYTDVIRREHLSLIEPTFPETNERMVEAYANIFAMAEKHNWKIIAVTTPFAKEYNALYDDEFYDVFYDTLHTLMDGHIAQYWDYSHDSRFTDTPAYFMDLDHLEVEGQKLFSEILAQRLGLIP